MYLRLDNKTAILTGGATGMGRAIACGEFLGGAHLGILDLDNTPPGRIRKSPQPKVK